MKRVGSEGEGSEGGGGEGGRKGGGGGRRGDGSGGGMSKKESDKTGGRREAKEDGAKAKHITMTPDTDLPHPTIKSALACRLHIC